MTEQQLQPAEIAYIAGIIDTRGYLGRRKSGALELPSVAVTLKSGSPIIARLCQLTGVTPISLRKNHDKTACADHCPQPHVHVSGDYERWIVTGIKARIVLGACLPYLWALRQDVGEVLESSDGQPFKPASVTKMVEAGWPMGKAS